MNRVQSVPERIPVGTPPAIGVGPLIVCEPCLLALLASLMTQYLIGHDLLLYYIIKCRPSTGNGESC